jgi:crotonobetainyl-CoA:carnitine CoA-transferase CaiB-like acyl-CoA transferase
VSPRTGRGHGDDEELRDRLAQLLGDRALAARMGQRGREVVLEQFTGMPVPAAALSAYEELLASPATSGAV